MLSLGSHRACERGVGMERYEEIKRLHQYCNKIGLPAILKPEFDGYVLYFPNGGEFNQHKGSIGHDYNCVEPSIGCKTDFKAVSFEIAKILIDAHKDRLGVPCEENKGYVARFFFCEEDAAGGFDTEPVEYRKSAESEESLKDYEDLVFQAIEIEGYDRSEVLVTATFTKDGEYLDSENFILRVNAVRTEEPSRFVEWGDKKPHIFTVDRKRSRLEFVGV